MKCNRRKLLIKMADACLTMGELAKRTKCSAATISHACNGASVSGITIKKIATALGCSIEDICADEI